MKKHNSKSQEKREAINKKGKMIREPLSQEKKEMKYIDKLEKMHKKYR
jgi:hypothetical protein